MCSIISFHAALRMSVGAHVRLPTLPCCHMMYVVVCPSLGPLRGPRMAIVAPEERVT